MVDFFRHARKTDAAGNPQAVAPRVTRAWKYLKMLEPDA
jgi:hypothetical protein